jgi:hypothetical protein
LAQGENYWFWSYYTVLPTLPGVSDWQTVDQSEVEPEVVRSATQIGTARAGDPGVIFASGLGERSATPHFPKTHTTCGLAVFSRVLWVSISAYGLALTYYSPQFAALAWVALVPLFLVIRKVDTYGAIGYGLLWGVAFFGLYGTIRVGVLSATLLQFVAIGAISFALLSFCLNRIAKKLGFHPVILGLAWLIYELVRIELVLHSGTLAASQPIDGLTLKIIAISGLSGLSFLIVVVNVCLMLFWNWVRKNWKGRSGRDWCERPLLVPAGGFVLTHTPCYLLPEERGPPLPPEHRIRVWGCSDHGPERKATRFRTGSNKRNTTATEVRSCENGNRFYAWFVQGLL